MATPTQHAVCSASASERWLHCTAAPRFEQQFPSVPTKYTEEGTLAHSFCELAAKKEFGIITPQKYGRAVKALKNNDLYDDEMLRTAAFYEQFLRETAMTFDVPPHVALEVRVDISDIVPGGFGTCDSVMVGGNRLHITDYKHGKGVAVDADHNSQMQLYALGALKTYSAVFGDTIREVSMAICQPRITEDVQVCHMTVDELRAWGEQVKPLALEAYNGPGEFHPGEWCRFCRGRAVCRARADQNTGYEVFKDVLLPNAPAPKDNEGKAPRLSDAEVADLLGRAADLVGWYSDLQGYALQAILDGKDIPGYKVVAGRSNRVFTDPDAALAAMRGAGYKDAVLFDRKPKSLSELEKLAGKKSFAEITKGLVYKPLGKPTLTTADDKREDYNVSAAMFKDVAKK